MCFMCHKKHLSSFKFWFFSVSFLRLVQKLFSGGYRGGGRITEVSAWHVCACASTFAKTGIDWVWEEEEEEENAGAEIGTKRIFISQDASTVRNARKFRLGYKNWSWRCYADKHTKHEKRTWNLEMTLCARARLTSTMVLGKATAFWLCWIAMAVAKTTAPVVNDRLPIKISTHTHTQLTAHSGGATASTHTPNQSTKHNKFKK